MLKNKQYHQESVFRPENLLREARRQKSIENCPIPRICVLDPDGDIVSYLIESKEARLNKCWAGYHTKMFEFTRNGIPIGIIGNAVGAPFAVLLAEQMFVSGCEFLISITSAGIINLPESNPDYILIKKALRDEGTSLHYAPPAEFAVLPEHLFGLANQIIATPQIKIEYGTSWTTDAPYRETLHAIEDAGVRNISVVEMECSALYTFANRNNKSVICFAHPTNSMAQNQGDFEKGENNGSVKSLELIKHVVKIVNHKINDHKVIDPT